MKRLSKAVHDRVGGRKTTTGGVTNAPLLPDDELPSEADAKTPGNTLHDDLEEVELQLVHVLQQNGVGEICRTIKAEIDTIWAVQSAFKTLASVGHFYFSCGETVFAVSPADGFYDSDGLVLALFALKKFPHQKEVLCPILDTISIYAKLDVERALTFCAIDDGVELVMNCVRNHYDKPDLICMAHEALGSLILNDDIRLHIASRRLIEELLALLRRYKANMEVSRAVLYPLSHFVVLKDMAHAFVDLNGIPTALQCLKMHKDDQQAAWYAIALLNALTTDPYHVQLIGSVFAQRGVHIIARAIAKHVEVEEIALEGFHLLESIATVSDFFPVINQNHVLELAYLALSLYKGPQYTHTRLEIKKRVLAFQTCAIQDGHAYAMQERLTKGDCIMYTLFVVLTAIAAALSPYDHQTHHETQALTQSMRLPPTFSDINAVWSYLQTPFIHALFPSVPADSMATPTMLHASNVLLGSVQLHQRRLNSVDLSEDSSTHAFGQWTPDRGYPASLPTDAVLAPNCNDPTCVLSRLQERQWLDVYTRTVVVDWNVYNAALDVHVAMTLSLDFPVGAAVQAHLRATPAYFNVYRGVFFTSGLFYVDMGLLGFSLYTAWRAGGKLHRYRQYYLLIGAHVVDCAIVVLWLAIWCTRLQFVSTASYALMLQLAGPSYVSLRDVTALAQQDRVLFAIVSLVMWLNWTRYWSFHNLRYLLCVLEATTGYIVGYSLLIVLVLVGVAHYMMLSTPWSAPWTFLDHFTAAIHALSTHGLASPSLPTWHGYLLFFGFNVLMPLVLLFLLAPLFRLGFNICPREPPKRAAAKAWTTSLKGHKKPLRTNMKVAFHTAKVALKRMLEDRQSAIRKHSFSPWEKSDASLVDDITEANYVNPSAPSILQELQRGVVHLAVEEQHLDLLASTLLKRLQQLDLLLRSTFSRSSKAPLTTPVSLENTRRTFSLSYAQRRGQSSGTSEDKENIDEPSALEQEHA
ncbi:hypothetical protein H310_08273 [Aphanomyces invadans]|uniref:Polycystin domain-containing protein n=1 Tax=Aphanomyces invadans TaxID=157072 RepID=A0A024U034_9STRA|nr:hypothetical protein H310_08273 [Aphanomyces invadans]ETV99623.1 hypothetical protein H310_08273 [Aphanomyces invadans]|eukprot:XP_008872179.1 hypothetical protein H310_08273 [Aphanomyces invadans]